MVDTGVRESPHLLFQTCVANRWRRDIRVKLRISTDGNAEDPPVPSLRIGDILGRWHYTDAA